MTRSTLILVVIAALTAAGAMSMRPKPPADIQFEDEGQPLFKDFTDPTLATSLKVVSWDDKSAQTIEFSVEQKEGRWVIPSHNDYPADGTERMGKAAASFIDVKKDIYKGDRAEDYAAFGVLDPTAAEGKADEKGTRITIKDASGAVQVDVIVGKSVEGKQGMTYVREAEGKRVYASKLDIDISTDFTDWIEKDLLHVERDEFVKVIYDPYVVDEQIGQVKDKNPIMANLVAGDDGKEEWTADPQTPAPRGKILDNSKVRQIATSIANVKIVGVRPRPKPLTQRALQAAGFFVAEGGRRLFGNEGEATAITKDGVVFTLFFGEITYESGLALTAGGTASEAPKDAEGEDADKDKSANRYMFVNVDYDPTLDQTKQDAASAEDTPATDDKELKGQARAEKLSQRFGDWFYVISDSSFKQIHKDRADLFKDKPADEEKTKP